MWGGGGGVVSCKSGIGGRENLRDLEPTSVTQRYKSIKISRSLSIFQRKLPESLQRSTQNL